jgi:hypothetical protein
MRSCRWIPRVAAPPSPLSWLKECLLGPEGWLSDRVHRGAVVEVPETTERE